jgi:DNA-binding PadR family transcriptional regulator
MSLNHAILGLLSREPMTGYEIKKIFRGTPFLHWSGNNNQIYKAFAELLDEGFVAKEVRHREGAPSKNIYTITDAGLEMFHRWLAGAVEEPVFRKQILIRLALADRLKRADLERMLDAYAETVRLQAALAEQELDKCWFANQADSGANRFFGLIRENVLSFYASELEWIRKARAFIAELPDEDGEAHEPMVGNENEKAGSKMNPIIKELRGKRYLHLTGGGSPIGTEQDAIDIIALCVEHDTNAVLLDGGALSDDFVRLRTGLAGAVLQKFVNYNIKAAAVVEHGRQFPERFREMISEYRNGNTFRVFTDPEEAVEWLLG